VNIGRTVVGGIGAMAASMAGPIAASRFGVSAAYLPVASVALGYLLGKSGNQMLRDAGSGAAVVGIAQAGGMLLSKFGGPK
jgi:hypothetical protein